MGATGVIMSLSFRESKVNQDDATIVIPATAAVGDLAVLSIVGRNNSSSAPALTPDQGFTFRVGDVDQGADPSTRAELWTKVLVSGDPGKTITITDPGLIERQTLMFFEPSLPIGTVTLQNAGGTIDDTDQSVTITEIGRTRPFVGIALFTHRIQAGISDGIASMTEAEFIDVVSSLRSTYRIRNVGDTLANQSLTSGDNGTDNGLLKLILEVSE